MKFKVVVVGGTFYPFHKGHKVLLKKAIEVGEEVIVGLTSDRFARRKRTLIKPYKIRKKTLAEFFKKEVTFEKVKITQISNHYGPTISDPNIEAIVVSPESRYRAEEINELRKKANLEPLTIIEIPFVLAENGEPISSAKILKGIIDTEGRLCKK